MRRKIQVDVLFLFEESCVEFGVSDGDCKVHEVAGGAELGEDPFQTTNHTIVGIPVERHPTLLGIDESFVKQNIICPVGQLAFDSRIWRRRSWPIWQGGRDAHACARELLQEEVT